MQNLSSNEKENGIKCESVVEWYLSTHYMTEIENGGSEVFDKQKDIVQKVISRMIKHDGLIIEVEEYQDGDVISSRFMDKLIRIHPSADA